MVPLAWAPAICGAASVTAPAPASARRAWRRVVVVLVIFFLPSRTNPQVRRGILGARLEPGKAAGAAWYAKFNTERGGSSSARRKPPPPFAQ
ncbi:hypothetical protein RGUI_3002 [Rhodovulum sp. P5]|nr:hypothetical protein RGUI_3002 [Rhodovulum sp. P5]